MLDLRPGHRAWDALPAGLIEGTEAVSALQYALGTNTQVYAYSSVDALRAALASWCAQGWVLFIETGTGRQAGSWFHWLRHTQGSRLYRITPGTATHDIANYITDASPVRVVIAPQADPGTAVHLDLEELFFRINNARPDVLCIADVSHSLGLVPFYADAWGAGAVVYSRPGLGHWLCTAQAVGAPADAQLLPLMAKYVAHTQRVGLPEIWNATHHEARTFRQWLAAQGAVLTSAFLGDALTGFRFPDETPEATAERFRTEFRLKVAVDIDLHRQPHVVIQHAPGGWEIG